jgi:hypothetical protein
MTNIDIIKEGFAACESGNINKLSGLISDDFQMEGPLPEPVGKQEFIGLMSAMVTAIPDWKFNPINFQDKGDRVLLSTRISGTQTGTLTLPNLPHSISPTGKHIQLPAEPQEISIREGKMTHYKVDSVPGGGVQGLLAQLGVAMPMH